MTIDLRDLAVEHVDQREGYSVEFAPSPEAHREMYEEELGRLIDGRVYVTPSGRRWRASIGTIGTWGRVRMTPLGFDAFGFGGVKVRYVDPKRLEGFDKTWVPTDEAR